MLKLSLESQLLGKLQHDGLDGVLRNDLCEYKAIFLSRIIPDPSNPRYLPVVLIRDSDASQFTRRVVSKQQLLEKYSAQNKVMVGKGCFINCMPKDEKAWRKINQSIQSIVELAENIKCSEVIQVPTVFPIEDGNYQILTGHRRFLATVFVYGVEGVGQFKVYREKPLLKKTKQFLENASREDLPQYGKLAAFRESKEELEMLSRASQKLGRKKLTIKEMADSMGISMGAFDNYNVLVRYPSVEKCYQDGMSKPFRYVKKVVLDTEERFRKSYGVTVLNINHKQEIDQQLKDLLESGRAAPAKQNSIKFPGITSPQIVRHLLSENILSLDIGIDWDLVDWNDAKIVSEVVRKVIKSLEEHHTKSN